MNLQRPKKGVLITILVLLAICLPLSIISFALHIMDENDPNKNIEENPLHQLYYEGKLYFYDEDDTLIGTYTCQNKNEKFCNLAESELDDTLYSLDYYQSEQKTISIIQNKYAFLIDSKEEVKKPFLYDIQSNRAMATYASVKNYGIGIEKNLFIVGDANLKYGVISLEGSPNIAVAFDYDFIGIANLIDKEENKIMNDLLAVYKNKSWYLIDANGAVLTSPIEKQIVSYNGQYIIVKDALGYDLVNYRNQSQLKEAPYFHLSFTGKYLNIIDDYNDFYVYDITSKKNICEPIHIKNTDTITSQINEKGNLDIIENNKIIQTIELS